jgi:hypothetical protein
MKDGLNGQPAIQEQTSQHGAGKIDEHGEDDPSTVQHMGETDHQH